MSLADDILATGAGVRLTVSTVDADRVVVEEPRVLVAQSELRGYRTYLDEYALARVIASEYGSGPPIGMLCIGDTQLNRARARGISVFDEVTAGSGRFGSQGTPTRGGARPCSTKLDPQVKHLRCARMLLGGQARGVALGAQNYLSPRAQLSLWSKGTAGVGTHHHPQTVLERWVFNKPILSTSRDDDGRLHAVLGPVGSGRGKEPVFPCGVSAWEQLFFRPATSERQARYELARQLVASGGRELPPCEERGNTGALELALAAALAAVAAGLVN